MKDQMELHMDPDVKMVLEFMQTNIVCSKIVAVANSVKELATPLWGHHESEKVIPISLKDGSIFTRGKLSISSE